MQGASMHAQDMLQCAHSWELAHRSDIGGVAVIGEHRLVVVGGDLVQADLRVACRGQQALVGGDLELVDLSTAPMTVLGHVACKDRFGRRYMYMQS